MVLSSQDVFSSEIQAFRLMLPNLFIYHVYFVMVCFLDLLLQKHELFQGRCRVTVSDIQESSS